MNHNAKYIAYSLFIAAAICFVLIVGFEIAVPRKSTDMFGGGVIGIVLSPFVWLGCLFAVYNIPSLRKRAEKFGD